jgi:hypothetical protein
MQSSDWITLLRLVPPAQQENLMFTTTTGIEIVVLSILRTESEYVLVRGRQTGNPDGGNIFFIPYDRILFMGYQKPIKEGEVRALFDPQWAATHPEPLTVAGPAAAAAVSPPVPTAEPVPVSPGAMPTAPVGDSVPPKPAATPTPAPPPAETAAPKPVTGTNKAALLERLRARRAESAGNRTPV